MTYHTTPQYNIYHDDYSFYGFHLDELQKSMPRDDFFVTMLDFHFNEHSQADAEQDIADSIQTLMGEEYLVRIQHYENTAFYINVHTKIGGKKVMMIAGRAGRMNYEPNVFEKKKGLFTFRICGNRGMVERVAKLLYQPPRFQATMKWYFMADGRTDYRTIEIEQKHKVHDEMYPWIEGGVHNYFKKYLESDANVLILLGEPGTGKTTFIRELIVANGLEAMITYEEDLMSSDRLYIDLVTGEQDVLIMEDADLMLKSREQAGNKLMSKLLNISDGLMKNKKKIIFTANISYNSINQTDHALIRPGRCFDVVNFRPLDSSEAKAAAKAMGVAEPVGNKDITLAKLTNPDYIDPDVQKVGFF